MKIIAIILAILLPVTALAGPVLNFSDITSGPATGLGDGLGSGAIVTVWGNNLGTSAGAYPPATTPPSGISLCTGSDGSGTCTPAAYIYYWKNADGTLPGGPADLYTWHKMQEIAFSIPSGLANGTYYIKATAAGVASNTLAFTVRAGSIKFVRVGGSDNNNGAYATPYATLNGAMDGSHVTAGQTLYSVGVGSTAGIKIGGSTGIHATSGNETSIIAYPGTTVAVSGPVPGGTGTGTGAVVSNWYPGSRLNTYVNVSKLSVTAKGNCDTTKNDNECVGIYPTPYARIVGNKITGPTVYGGMSGAISATGNDGQLPDGAKLYGNYIHDYGYRPISCPSYTYDDDGDSWTSPTYSGIGDAGTCSKCSWSAGSSPSGVCTVDRFQHLFYISCRTASTCVPHEIAWGHYKDNPILHGIHIYDSGAGWTGDFKVHHNAIINQRGGAIDITIPTSNTVYIYNNLIKYDTSTNHQGLPFRITGGSTNYIYNNTVYGWHNFSYFEATNDILRNNIFLDTVGTAYIYTGDLPNTYSNNNCYGITAKPAWCNSNVDPLFTTAGTDFSLQSGSTMKSGGYSLSSASWYLPLQDLVGNAITASSPPYGAFTAASSDSPATPVTFTGRFSGGGHIK